PFIDIHWNSRSVDRIAGNDVAIPVEDDSDHHSIAEAICLRPATFDWLWTQGRIRRHVRNLVDDLLVAPALRELSLAWPTRAGAVPTTAFLSPIAIQDVLPSLRGHQVDVPRRLLRHRRCRRLVDR